MIFHEKSTTNPEISPKSTKDQILAAYNEVLKQLNEKQTEIPLNTKKADQATENVQLIACRALDARLCHDRGQECSFPAVRYYINLIFLCCKKRD